MEKKEERIIVLACIRRELKDLVLRIEDEIKACAKINAFTQVRYQSLNAKVYYGISHDKREAARKELALCLEAVIKGMEKI